MARKRVADKDGPTFLSIARRAAQQCGVTRLADITGLDRLGLPVWQAVRPASRALSVHQGKALTEAGAQIGALCEAVESHSAEQVAADGPHCAWRDLPAERRLLHPDDVLADRDRPADWNMPIAWCAATDLVGGDSHYLPHEFVSLDFRHAPPSRIERSSNGLGAGPDETSALTTALLELIERDAVACWARSGAVARLASRIDLRSVPFAWFQAWRERLAMRGAALTVFALRSLTGAAAFRCEIGGDQAFGPGLRLASGTAAHFEAETALAKAFAEAAQSRLTLIAGARDDFYHRHYAQPPAEPADEDDEDDESPPGQTWTAPGSTSHPLAQTVDNLVAHGYRHVLMKRLDRDLDGVCVVKVFVPGLALLGRARRVPT